MSSRLKFRVEAQASNSRARAARFQTLHGEVLTPTFMPVGTNATVKSQNLSSLSQSGSQVLLANTYHLLLRPGPEVFLKAGGIHKFMNWKGSVLTDSGGFQIFSLPNCRTMTEEGALFRSYVDGSTIKLTPEKSIEVQRAIGSDIMMVLDQCVPSTCDHATAKAAMELTHRWAKRSLDARGDSPQSIFAIVQGACFEDLRRESAQTLTQMPFDGFAIGGLAVGETRSQREDFTELAAGLLPAHLPRYLMGVGTPLDILEAVHRGVDMFDCILPTALAQQGVGYTSRGRVRLSRGIYKFSQEPLDPNCGCPVCTQFTRSYLHHLTKAGEVLGWSLIGEHNLYFYHRLMAGARAAILENSFMDYYKSWKPTLESEDEDNPPLIPVAKKRKTRPRVLGVYEVKESTDGTFASIRHIESGEVMHSVIAPHEEARRLYIEQSALAAKLQIPSDKPLVLWDVGLGAAHNAMAALLEAEKLSQAGLLARDLEIVSFENDLDALKLALIHPALFPHLKHGAPTTLIKEGLWTSKNGRLKWALLHGDFRELLDQAAPPEIVYFDPFSSKTNPSLWTHNLFQKLREHCRELATELFTYSASTAVRASLLASGFFVASGVGTGPKAETTIALLDPKSRGENVELLADEWLRRWEASHAKIPQDISAEHQESFLSLIRKHVQFQTLKATK